MPKPHSTSDRQVYSLYRNSRVSVKTPHPPEKHFNRQRWCFFGKNQHWHCYLHSLRRITNISLLHFLFGLRLNTNILCRANRARIQLIRLRVLLQVHSAKTSGLPRAVTGPGPMTRGRAAAGAGPLENTPAILLSPTRHLRGEDVTQKSAICNSL